ncbi:hypothetical protein [Sorangium sp. So ce1182]|uniref:hypothetical protein n=1 Tax=Sorangium sp. So ce1182 TaxID=3133334 RepID=UPI003F5D73B1
MKHAAIIEVLLKHAFYADQRCPDLAIEPSDDTARLLRNHRCIVRSGPEGVRVLSPLDAAGQPFLPLPGDATLLFYIEVRGGDFAVVTDLTGIGGRAAPVFTDAGAGTDGELGLAPADPARPRLPPGIVAAVEIRPGSAPRPARYQVSFQARRARWAYYCVTDLAPAGGELTVVDASPAAADGALRFSAATLDPVDPIAAQIAGRYPGMRCVYFVSDEPVAAREEPRKSIELRLGTDRVAGPLPNPSMQSPAKEDLLFQIVTYRAQPFQTP